MIPDSFGMGLMVPIPKSDSASSNTVTADFRGITISPVVSKVFEHCLTKCLSKYLVTSDLQFGFKVGLGCSHAIYVVRKSVNYFTTNNSTVNLCALDLSKAFDKVIYWALLSKMLDRNIPHIFVLHLSCWYSKMFQKNC